MVPVQKYLMLIALLAVTACGGGGGPVVEDPDLPPDQTGDADPDPRDSRSDPTDSDDDSNGSNAPDDQDDPDDNSPDDPTDPVPPDLPEPSDSVFEQALRDGPDANVALGAIAVTQSGGDLVLERRDGLFTFADGGVTVDGVAAQFLSDIPGDFDASSVFSAGNDSGLFGIATGAGQMQSSGTADFSGGAVGFIITAAGGVELRNGKSDVSVDFDSARLTATMSDFQIVDAETFVVVDQPLETITLRDATVNGDTFAGGTLELRSASAAIDSTGANTDLQAEGQFFGVAAGGGGADEVGGLIVATGDDGQVFVEFLAD